MNAQYITHTPKLSPECGRTYNDGHVCFLEACLNGGHRFLGLGFLHKVRLRVFILSYAVTATRFPRFSMISQVLGVTYDGGLHVSCSVSLCCGVCVGVFGGVLSVFCGVPTADV